MSNHNDEHLISSSAHPYTLTTQIFIAGRHLKSARIGRLAARFLFNSINSGVHQSPPNKPGSTYTPTKGRDATLGSECSNNTSFLADSIVMYPCLILPCTSDIDRGPLKFFASAVGMIGIGLMGVAW